jgi:hypothetical protein
MAQTTTLAQVERWLSLKPAQEVICWDTFHPWHCLMVRYYEDKGHWPVRSEYDRAMIDTHMQDIRGDKKPVESTKRLLSTYEPDLAQFAYHLAETPLRFKPTAAALLEYLHTGDWKTDTKELYGWEKPEVFNAHYDAPDKPEDVKWEHLDIVPFQGTSWRVYTSVEPPLFYFNKGVDWRHVDINILRHKWENLADLWYKVSHKGRQESTNCCQGISNLWLRASSRLYEGDTITLYLPGKEEQEMGTWQRTGERVVRIA